MVGLSGLEPPTSRLSGVRSNQLSYRPIYIIGIKLLTLNDPYRVRTFKTEYNMSNAIPHIPKGWSVIILRKEVIQPHLPIRLPCYDFTPIINPTFDGCLHKGWPTGFRCY